MSTIATRLQALLRPGDTLWWGQATAEPLTLTRTLVQHRHALAQGGRLQVFVGLGLSDTLQPAHADVLDFLGYAASGPHRASHSTPQKRARLTWMVCSAGDLSSTSEKKNSFQALMKV